MSATLAGTCALPLAANGQRAIIQGPQLATRFSTGLVRTLDPQYVSNPPKH